MRQKAVKKKRRKERARQNNLRIPSKPAVWIVAHISRLHSVAANVILGVAMVVYVSTGYE